MYSCKQASFLLSQAKERKLRLNETLQLKLHLAFCSHCRQFKLNLETMSELCQGISKQK
ncbi:anti-sigma factor family protein [Gallibacterium trehalosifermentans]|uniref:anti-sigma factor family protein n=1 Tax=Gallibacterium trehalosifermentans TaxID=516935 RepID=UPI00406BA0A1